MENPVQPSLQMTTKMQFNWRKIVTQTHQKYKTCFWSVCVESGHNANHY